MLVHLISIVNFFCSYYTDDEKSDETDYLILIHTVVAGGAEDGGPWRTTVLACLHLGLDFNQGER